MSLIERIAQSVADQFDDRFVELLDPEGPLSSYGLSHAIARAVLKAMREPTEKMVERAAEYDSEGGYETWGGPQDIGDHDRHTWEPNATRLWRVMIDAALEEG